jgi:hypothetical protein
MSMPADRRRDAVAARWALTTSLGAWLVATLISQHPHRGFDRLREHDPVGLLLPNWRFFAPEPAQHDFHLLHRVLTADGEQSDWVETAELIPRAWIHAVWFPDRRQGKAISDITNELIRILGSASADVSKTVPFELLRDLVELKVREDYSGRPLPQGFQLLIARHTGHDPAHEPDYLMASQFVALDAATC